MKTLTGSGQKQIFLSELTEEQKKLFIEDNREYLIWADSSEITEDQLEKFMLVQHEDSDVWSLTLKNEDFYIEDVIFEC